jgi:DNA end-binding protein Ku
MARAIWKGSISFGLVHIPVSVVTAEKKDEIQLRMLDRQDLSPIGYVRRSKKTGREVPWEDIVRGYEHAEGQYVVLTDEDLRRAKVESTQTIEIVDFVNAAEIQPYYYERPYFLEPPKKGAKAYALLREALVRTGRVGVAKVVIQTRQHLAALIPSGRVLLLDLLRYANELRDPLELELPPEGLAENKIQPKELEMAEKLIESMAASWEPAQYTDDYREALLAFVQRKVESGEVQEIEEPAKEEAEPQRAGEVVDLMALLRKSVEQTARREQPAKAQQAKVEPARRRTKKKSA